MLRTGDGYVLDLDAIDAALSAGAASVLLCNPANPVGRVFQRDELAALADNVERHRAFVISDETHAPLRYGVAFTPYAEIDERTRHHSVTLFGASKAWNIPGLCLGFIAVTNPAHRAAWATLPDAATAGISPLGIAASAAAFQDGKAWLANTLEYLTEQRATLGRIFDDAGVGCHTQPGGRRRAPR